MAEHSANTVTSPGPATRNWLAALGLLLALGSILAKASQLGAVYFGMAPIVSANLFWWAMAALVPLYVLLVERRPLSSIGLKRPDWKTFAFGLGAVVACIAAMPLVMLALRALHEQGQMGSPQSNALAALPFWFRLQLVARAALAEEIVFRGYTIERVEQLTGSRVAAFVVSVATFTLAHLAYWGWGAMIGVATVGTIVTLLYQWRRDLGANMVAHFVLDGIQLLL